jgi:hypothetical protein
LNAFSIFNKSIEVCQKQFDLFNQFENDEDVTTANLKFILGNSISAFDALGKELRKKFTNKFPEKPKNLFQNIDELEKILTSGFQLDIKNQLSNFFLLRQMFQVRHIFEHNMGVVDSDFIKKMPSFGYLLNRKYPLAKPEVEKFLSLMRELGQIIQKEIEKLGN